MLQLSIYWFVVQLSVIVFEQADHFEI